MAKGSSIVIVVLSWFFAVGAWGGNAPYDFEISSVCASENVLDEKEVSILLAERGWPKVRDKPMRAAAVNLDDDANDEYLVANACGDDAHCAWYVIDTHPTAIVGVLHGHLLQIRLKEAGWADIRGLYRGERGTGALTDYRFDDGWFLFGAMGSFLCEEPCERFECIGDTECCPSRRVPQNQPSSGAQPN